MSETVNEPVSTRSPLSISAFRAVWITNLVSNLGNAIQMVGASWLMTSLTPSSTFVALVQSATCLPILLLSLWSGAFADNRSCRIVMIWGNL
jgi:hypothetical protein